MAINEHAPSVSIVYPSGSEGNPEKYFVTSLDSNPVIQWTYSDPENTEISQIHAKVYDGDQLVWDSGSVELPQFPDKDLLGSGLLPLFSLRHLELPDHEVLPFNKEYSIIIRAMDTTEDPRWQKWGEWSDPAFFEVEIDETALFVSFDVTIYADSYQEKIFINWTDDAAEFGDVLGYNVLRSTERDRNFQPVNGSLLIGDHSSYIDDTAAASTRYYYKIEVVMEDGSIAVSPVTYGSIFHAFWSIGSFKFAPTSFKKRRERAQSKRAVLGQKKKVVQDRGFRGEEMDLVIDLLDDHDSTGEQKYNQLMDELEKTEALTMRDPFGRVWTFVPSDFDDEQLLTGRLEYRVSFSVSEVDG